MQRAVSPDLKPLSRRNVSGHRHRILCLLHPCDKLADSYSGAMKPVQNLRSVAMKQAADSSLIVRLDIVEQENQPLGAWQLRKHCLQVEFLHVATNGSVSFFGRRLR